MNNMTFMELMGKGGWVRWVRFLASLMIFTFFLERLWAFATVGNVDGPLLRAREAVRAPGPG